MTTITPQQRANHHSPALHPATTDTAYPVDDAVFPVDVTVTPTPRIDIPRAYGPQSPSRPDLGTHASPPSALASGFNLRDHTSPFGHWLTTEIAATLIACLAIWFVFLGLSYLA